ncbi:uncharacterized protein PV09_09786 [Verruconis gallopava]|uniref:Xylanolytic transcriptional activator regulatory domain-containing protein n=1 Tax=Verruconis gallopava TaxID=253628 RepID=A0A0D1YCG7_9PEZI|nr:uncharacterized protein PV09_09786 [Verruconis gallopava]KIV98381.1 hypothetical protein PV09_09786 [Verruconis gallopava]
MEVNTTVLNTEIFESRDRRLALEFLKPRSAFTIILILWLLDIIYKCTFHPLAKVPGPFLARFSQAWRNIRYFRGTWHDDVVALHREYGRIVRVAPNEVSVVDTAALKHLYGHGTKALKTHWYDTWKIPNMTESFFSSTDVKIHRHLRSRVSSAYSMTSVLAMEPFIQQVADECWRKFSEFADTNQPVPMHQWGNYFAFDVVGTLAMGGKIGFIEQGRDVDGIIRSIHDGFYTMANMGNMPLQMFWFNNKVAQFVIKRFGGKRFNAFSVFLEWLEKRVEDRLQNGLQGKRRDMLQHFIEAKDMSGRPVKKGDIMIEGVNILGAGADTTTIGILAIIGALLQHPKQLERLQKEIDEAYESLGLGGTDEISFKDAEKLPFLSAVIKESTRLHPSIQYQLPRYVPRGGSQVGPHRLPEGSICGISPAAMNRSKEIFGEDAEDWSPDRWIARNEDEENTIKERNALLTTFGMGSRVCIGKNLAMVEMYKFTAQFFRHFDAELVDKSRPWVIKTQWFAFQHDFWVNLRRREHKRLRCNGKDGLADSIKQLSKELGESEPAQQVGWSSEQQAPMDVLKRHWRTCKFRQEQDEQIPWLPPKTRGKKRKACDRCVRLKRACSSGYWCGSCKEHNYVCTFNGVAQKQVHNGSDDAGPVSLEDQSSLQERELASMQASAEQIDHSNIIIPGFDTAFDLELLRKDEGHENFDTSWLFETEEKNGSPLLLNHTPLREATEFWLDIPSDRDIGSISNFPFLSKFTTEGGFLESFDCGSLIQRQKIAEQSFENFLSMQKPHLHDEGIGFGSSASVHGSSSYVDTAGGNNPSILFVSNQLRWHFDTCTLESGLFSQSELDATRVNLDPSPSYSFLSSGSLQLLLNDDELSPKTYEIVKEIKFITCNKPRGSKITISWSPKLEHMCFDFFSPDNLRRFLNFFWCCWYPNCPIIHRPTFVASSTCHMLLLSMVLIGACMSPDEGDHANANLWFNSVEEMIFSCDDLYDIDSDDPALDSARRRRGLEILQAAYFVCLLQNWEGSEESKRRIRRHRYTTLIAFARDYGFSNATLQNLHIEDISTFQWGDFVRKESLIRTFTFIFLLDTAFAIFNSLPPRLVVRELKMDLACPEPCFQACSFEECFVQLRAWTSPQTHRQMLDVSSAVELMCHPQISRQCQVRLNSLSTLNMFTLVTALHSLAFSIQNSLISDSEMSPLHSGIENWKQLWVTGNLREMPEIDEQDLLATMWKRVGFFQHALEFWLLVKATVGQMHSLRPNQSCTYVVDNSLGDGARSVRSMKYDADMSQVHAIITALQNFNLSEL